MAAEEKWTELVRLAQQGHENCMDSLARGVEGRICAYIYRVTMDYELTGDLSQEVLLQMFKSLDRLDDAERFWPWLYRIAQSKIQQHYKESRRKKSLSETGLYQEFLSKRNINRDDAMHRLIQKELSKKVVVAMKHIKHKYRAVLSLRCFEQLSYSDIAIAMQCSEVRARVMFYRAKQALRKQLANQGVNKSMLLLCLGVFGTLTTTAKASTAVTVPAAATKVGFITAALATASSKIGVTTAAVMLLASIGAMQVFSGTKFPESETPVNSKADVTSLHFIAQLMDNDPNSGGSLSKGSYEQWFYFPEGADGPSLMRMLRWTVNLDKKQCSWLESCCGNYYYDSAAKQVYARNARVCWSNLRVRRLPTDSEEFIEFLSLVEGDLPASYEYRRDRRTGFLRSSMDYRFINAPDFQTNYRYNTIDQDLFLYDWPCEVPFIDNRDQMHKRGWTYFRISGRVNDRKISGRGRIPFFYNACKEYPAWIELSIDDKIEIIDCNDGAQLQRADGMLIAFPAGTFFKGLARPWMGNHTADCVRRDAAERKIWFESKRLEDETNVIITLFNGEEPNDVNLIYVIDMENDVIRNIRFDVNGQSIGTLTFDYVQDINQISDEFTEPVISDNPQDFTKKDMGGLWIIDLARGELGS